MTIFKLKLAAEHEPKDILRNNKNDTEEKEEEDQGKALHFCPTRNLLSTPAIYRIYRYFKIVDLSRS